MNKPLTSWQKTLRALGYKVNWRSVHSKKRQSTKQQNFRFENLEPRKMLATVSFDSGRLEVTGTADPDTIVLRVSAGEVLVNGSGTGANAADVESVVVDGLAGNDRILLSRANFSGTSPEITINGGDGNDTIVGTARRDNIDGGEKATTGFMEVEEVTLFLEMEGKIFL